MSKSELIDAIDAALDGLPQTVFLEDRSVVALRPALREDKEAILAFARGLTEQDLLFLRVNITQASAVKNWLRNVAAGETVSILAVVDDAVVGYGTVDRNSARWTRRVGEIRVNVAPEYRGLGLGRHLTGKIFDVSRRIGLQKLVANMTPDQVGAQSAFVRLGFQPEALLTDYVEDREGHIHDLVIMTYDIDGLTNQVDAPLKL